MNEEEKALNKLSLLMQAINDEAEQERLNQGKNNPEMTLRTNS